METELMIYGGRMKTKPTKGASEASKSAPSIWSWSLTLYHLCSDIEIEENQTLEDVVGPPSEAPYVPKNRPGRQTGPKGVLADKAAHDREKRKEVGPNPSQQQKPRCTTG